jgi:hypothetical protein
MEYKTVIDSKDYSGTVDEFKEFLNTHQIIKKTCEFGAFNGYSTDRYILESDTDQTKYELRMIFNPIDSTHTLITGPVKLDTSNYSI